MKAIFSALAFAMVLGCGSRIEGEPEPATEPATQTDAAPAEAQTQPSEYHVLATETFGRCGTPQQIMAASTRDVVLFYGVDCVFSVDDKGDFWHHCPLQTTWMHCETATTCHGQVLINGVCSSLYDVRLVP